MRPIHGAAPGISAADHYTAMRDNAPLARPANPSEAVATDELHVFTPPSKAHIKRIRRNGNGNIPNPRPYPERERDKRLDFHKMVISQLGGSRTVVGEREDFSEPREPGVLTTLEAHYSQLAARQHAEAEAKAARKNLAWRAVATGQGELFA